MKRAIIEINEDLCDGCGLCIPGCPEGALRIVDGKARLVGDILCDGLGACVGECPTGALKVVERDAEAYDERLVIANIAGQGAQAVADHLRHLEEHGQTADLETARAWLAENGLQPEYRSRAPLSGSGCKPAGSCPGSAGRLLNEKGTGPAAGASALNTWPLQLRLLNPQAPFLRGAHLLLAADCVPVACPDFHQRYLLGRVPLILCPKLDHDVEDYITKLAEIFRTQEIASLTVIQMEVPCCSGTLRIAREALERAGVNLPLRRIVIEISGKEK